MNVCGVNVGVDSLLLVNLLHVDRACDAGVARDNLARAKLESGAQDRAASSLHGEFRERREARRGFGA